MVRPMEPGKAGASKDDDCYFFFYSTCQKGEGACPFRHSRAALGKEIVCRDWSQGKCSVGSQCPFRHMILDPSRSQTPCFYESTPNGCLKPHCVFKHSKARPKSSKSLSVVGGFGSDVEDSGDEEEKGEKSKMILPSVDMAEPEEEKPTRQILLQPHRRSAKDRLGGSISETNIDPGDLRARLRGKVEGGNGGRISKRSWSPGGDGSPVTRKRGVVNQGEEIRRHLGRRSREDPIDRDDEGRPSPKRQELSPAINEAVEALLASPKKSKSGGPVKLRKPKAQTKAAVAEADAPVSKSASEEYNARLEELVGPELAATYREQGIRLEL